MYGAPLFHYEQLSAVSQKNFINIMYVFFTKEMKAFRMVHQVALVQIPN